MEQSSSVNTRRTPETQEPIQEKGSTTTPYLTDVVWNVAQWGWQKWTQDYSGPQRAMEDYFAADKYSSAQKLAHLVDNYSSLGFKDANAFVVFGQKLIQEGDTLKSEFEAILRPINGLEGILNLAKALYQPTESGRATIASFKENLRTDPSYLAQETGKIMESSISIGQKAVHLMLFLDTNSVTEEQVVACFEKLPQSEQKIFLKSNEENEEHEELTATNLKGLLESQITPLPIVEVMKNFQAQLLGETVKTLFAMLPESEQTMCLQFQATIHCERHPKTAEVKSGDYGQPVTLEASMAPGSKINPWLGFIGGRPFHHFMDSTSAKPCGETAKQAIDKMITRLKEAKDAK
jgi:hypothetical protein